MRKNLLSSIALVAMGGILAAAIVPATPAQALADYTPEVVQVAEETTFDSLNRVPLQESGVLAELETNISGKIPLAGYEDGSALVRVSVFSAAASATVYAAGTPAMNVDANESASTTVLVPVTDGTVPISTDSPVTARVEALAYFAPDVQTPGATIALGKPITRIDSSVSIGMSALTAEDQRVSVVGIGGVPSSSVRAAHITVDTVLDTASVVTIAGQELSLPSGRSVFSTIVPVEQTGEISVKAQDGGSIRLDVRGWVSGAAQGMNTANATGGFVPSAGSSMTSFALSEGEPLPLSLPDSENSLANLALVSASASTDPNGAILKVGGAADGRSRGVLVDGATGALPQIAVIPAEQRLASLRGATQNIDLLPVGQILAPKSSTKGDAEVTIVAPEEIDLREIGTVELHGEVSSDAAVDRVEVYGNDILIGTAAVTYSATGVSWRLETGVPSGGSVTFKAELRTRDGGFADATANANVTLPLADDVVITDNTVIVNSNDILLLEDENIVFGTDPGLTPGDVLVADTSATAHEGALRHVVSVQRTAVGWEVVTTQAAITDVFLQVDSKTETPLLDDSTELLEPDGTDEDLEVIDEGVENSAIVPNGSESASHAMRSSAKLADTPVKAGASLGGTLTATLKLVNIEGEKKKDLSKASNSSRSKADAAVKLSGGVSLAGTATMELALGFELKVAVEWGWGVPKPSLEYFKSSFTHKLELAYELAVSGGFTTDFEQRLARLNMTPVTVLAGPVPIVLVPGATLSVVGELTGEVGVSYSDSFVFGKESGAEYKNGKWAAIDKDLGDEGLEGDSCVGWGKHIEASGEMTGAAGLKVAGRILIYGVVGPQVSASAMGEASHSVTYDGESNKFTTKLSRALILGADVSIEFEFKVLGFKMEKSFTPASVEGKIDWGVSAEHQLPACNNDDSGGDDGGGEVGTEDFRIFGTVTDSASGGPLSGVEIAVIDGNGEEHRATTTSSGEYDLTVSEGNLSIAAEADGYIRYSRTISSAGAEERRLDIPMSTVLSGTEYRAVLTWDKTPRDLDSHLVGVEPNGVFHIYYGNKVVKDVQSGLELARLDVDDTSGFGPETTTFKVTENGNFVFYVHNFTGNTGEKLLSTSGANVVLYRGTEKVQEFSVPAGGKERFWNVFRITDGELEIVNSLSNDPALWGDSTGSSLNLLDEELAGVSEVDANEAARLTRETVLK